MSLVRWNPRRLRAWDDIDRVFDTVFPSFFSAMPREHWYPAVEIHESADTVEVEAELPGMKQEDIDISVRENVLTISGEKKQTREGRDESENVYYAERQFGKFERSLTLPTYVEVEKASASFKDGVLTIRLPKAEEHRSRQIQITTES